MVSYERNRLDVQQLQDAIQELVEWEALEIIFSQNDYENSVYFPYVMNDAVECYIRLKDCIVQGVYEKKIPVNKVSFVDGKLRLGIIFTQQNDNKVCIWYKEAYRELHPYQYHRIGHSWRAVAGQEQWRRVVNLLCVLHDKNQYLEPEATNEIEKRLIPLIEFAPICYWTPINESIETWYPETEAGIEAMIKICEEAKDKEYCKLVKEYLQMPEKKRSKKVDPLAKKLLKKEHQGILAVILSLLEEASLLWSIRDYTNEQLREMDHMRAEVVKKYENKGYEGEYPYMKKRCKDKLQSVYFSEEHPFTILESENYKFKIIEIIEEQAWE